MTREELLQIAKPILFNTEMVRAILEGRKTVTRRVVKPQQLTGLGCDRCPNNTPKEYIKEKKMLFKPYCDMTDNELIGAVYKEPYKSGDVLYVRETWKKWRTSKNYSYKEDWERDGIADIPKWKPSIHMPKEAARIFLKVKSVRVERLQEITENDAYGEGTDPWDDACYENNGWTPTFSDPDSGGPCDIISGFRKLWNSTIKKTDIDTYGWDANPYVWVIEFERVYPD